MEVYLEEGDCLDMIEVGEEDFLGMRSKRRVWNERIESEEAA